MGTPVVEIEILLGAAALFATLSLGVFIYFRNPKSDTNRLFFMLSLFISTYIIVNYFSLHPPTLSPESQLWWIRFVMLVCSFIGPMLVFFSYNFPHEHFSIPKKYGFWIFGLMIASVVCAITPLTFTGIEYPNGEPVPTPGPGIIVFLLDFPGLFALSFWILWRKWRKSPPGEDRNRIKLLLVGTLLSFSLMAISTVIFVVFLKTSAFVFLGPIFPVILMGVIAYAIATQEFLGPRVAATQILVAVIFVMLTARVSIASTQTEIIIDMFILLFTAIFGYLLVRSVKQEIRQRVEIEHLASDLTSANMRLQELDRKKSEFVSISSHQLRTPLTAIKGYSSLLLEGSYGPVPDDLKGPIQRIFDSSTLMAVSVNDFLNVARIESGKMIYDITDFDLRKVVSDMVTEFTPIVENKKLKFHFEPAGEACLVRADEGKVRQVIGNLIDNAVRYTPEGSITISMTCKDPHIKKVFVSDTGIGMSKSVQLALFEKFMRAENATKQAVSGTGLGLYVNKQMMDAMHGRIYATSLGEGKGSTFTIELPGA